MNTRIGSLLTGWLSLCFTLPALRAETLRFATIDYCPFTCSPATEGGKEGFMTDILREALEPAGYTLQIEMLPYVRAVKSVQEGVYDGIVVVGKDYAPDLVYRMSQRRPSGRCSWSTQERNGHTRGSNHWRRPGLALSEAIIMWMTT